jgi:two-component system response regulator
LRYPTDETPHDGLDTSAGQQPSTILLVEDNLNDIFIIKEIFKKHRINADLRVAPDGDQARRFWDSVEKMIVCPDLVLLDLNLPRASGLDVLSRIRNGNHCATVPVIIVSSSRSPSEVAACEALGISAYFQKTANLAEFMSLGNLIACLLPKKQLR